jgi:hypothetical protein
MNRDAIARTRVVDSQSAPSSPPSLPSHTHQIMEAFLWNNKSATRHEQRKHQEIQSLILSRLKRPAVNTNDEVEVRPLAPNRPELSPRDCGLISENDSWNHTVNMQTAINRRNNNRYLESPPQQYHPLSLQSDDEEEDIVCCDGGHFREGTKNLCTIAIWAIIVFFVINRFFIHMAMHLHKPQNVSRSSVRVVELGAQADADVDLGAQANAGVESGTQSIANVTLLGQQGVE